MAFRKVERSYHSTPNGWRLATFEEAKTGLETIKKKNLLRRWDRVRLLDGWITGPGYNFEIGNDYKGCLGYMLLIQTENSGGAYADVNLSDQGKEVAFLLCADDWNFEVVYWLLNCWSNSQTMNMWEVRCGNIPLDDVKKFEEMNKMIGHVARRLGEEGGKALEKSRKTAYTGSDSVKNVLSGMIKITGEEHIVHFLGRSKEKFKFDKDCFPDPVKTGDIADSFWSFVCDSFAGYLVESYACTSLVDIRKMKTKTGQNNWLIATSILFHLSQFLTDIIHEPLAHNCKDYCANNIMRNAAEKAGDNQQKFFEMLKRNAMWRCYDDTRNYGVLDKLLIVVAKHKYNEIEEEEKLDAVDMLLQCGAQPGRRHAIGKYKNKTVLHSIAKFRDEDVGTEVAQALLCICDEQSINEFVNAADERGRTALHSASKKGNTRICRLLADHGASVSAQDKKGMTALHYAFEGGFDKVRVVETEVAQALLCMCDEQSINEFVNAADERGRTALHRASEKGNTRICSLLLDFGVLVTASDKQGMTALHYAFEGSENLIDVETEIANALLSKVDGQSISEFVNATDERGRTALHLASKKANASVCELLVHRGALVTVQDKKCMTALHHACEGNIDKVKRVQIEIVQALLRKLNDSSIHEFVNAADERGRTALHAASEKGDSRICELLVRHGASVTSQDEKGMTALHYALGHIDKVKNVGKKIVEALLSMSDEQIIYKLVNTADKRGVTALHCASEKGIIDICKLLIDQGAVLTAQDENGQTALHYAFAGGLNKVVSMEMKIAEALLCKCDERSKYKIVNAADEKGRTALHCASEKGDIGSCVLFVGHGAVVTIKDNEGMTALHYALKGGIDKVKNETKEIAKTLLKSCDDRTIYGFVNTRDERGRTALHYASEKGNTEICELLVSHGALLTAQDNEGKTALHYAFAGGIDKVINAGIEIAQALVSGCFNVHTHEFINAVDKSGRTALHNASEKGNAGICNFLIDHGALVTARAENGKTTLHHAFEGEEREIGKDINVATEIAETLLRRCDEGSMYEFVNVADETGRTALHSASERGSGRICGLLVDHGASVTAQDGEGRTALHYAFEVGIAKDINVAREIAGALLLRCPEQIINEFVNAPDERGKTALHCASEKGDPRACELLVNHGALVTAQDKDGITALYRALAGRIDEVIDVLMKSPHVAEALDLKDNRGYTPLSIGLTNVDYKSTVKLLLQSKNPEDYLRRALANVNYETAAKLLLKSKEPEAYLNVALPQMDFESVAKLLSKLKNPQAYFYKVDQKQLLRNSLLLGSARIVSELFKNGIRLPAGDCDEEGKTVLHLAAMCDNGYRAFEIILKKLRGLTANEKKMVSERDRGGRTVLHEAALNGHTLLCQLLLSLNSELIYMRDRHDRNPLFDAVEGKYTGTALYKQLLKAYLKKDMPENDLMDRNGLTPLHVAASQGKVKVVKEFLSWDIIKTKYLSRGDIIAQTALHKAVTGGYIDTVEVLLKHGAHPLRERDRDGRTALHYAMQAEPERKIKLATMLLEACQSESEKSLLLWASAAGLGTAEQDLSKDDPLEKFLAHEKEKYKGNLLKMAVSLGDIEMTKELISRGYQIGDIRNPEGETGSQDVNVDNVNRVLGQIKRIKEQGNDKPTIFDNLGRLDYAQGLAALFLNPYIKPPIAVGVTGSWGTGKSSLMLQTERILLTTAAQMALFPSSKLSSSASELPDIKPCELSKKGKRKCERIYRQIMCREQVNRNIFVILWDHIKSKVKQSSVKDIQEEFEKFLNQYQYDIKYLKIFKALAAMDSSDMLQPKADHSEQENVQAVLTVQYNAWKYRNDTEALAGIAVEISKELEGIMTEAQWLSTCWRNTWKQNKYTLWIEIFFPSLLALVLVSSLTWIVWVVFDSDKLKEWGKTKYAWPPAALVIIVWTLTKSVMGILKPVSTQLLHYISFPDHTDKLGYQERVISDISFLKDEIGKKAHCVFIVFAWFLTTVRMLWGLITELCITSLIFHHRSLEKVIEAPKITPASGNDLRIIVFVDDLDRCQESVILQVLSAVNLVLAVCEINVVIGMDKRLIERAIIKKYKDVNANKSLKANRELADMYLQKIIQLPLDLPDPSDEESKRFLKEQLGVSENENRTSIQDERNSSNGDEERRVVQQNAAAQFSINMEATQEIQGMGHTNLRENVPAEARREVPPQRDGEGTVFRKGKPSSSTLVREMLFVRYYSKGEEEAFLYFQRLATDCRKHPREWKRLLNYHRLVWYIFSVSKEASNLVGWQVQLVTWIFICWEWQEYMNLVIKKWKEIDLKTKAPSLVMIVKHLMEEHSATIHESSENGSSEKLTNSMKKKLAELEKSLAELKKEMKELKASHESKKEMKELENQVSDQMKENMKEVKDQIVKMEREKNGKMWNGKNKKMRENWEKMMSALEKYDVSMDGIQAFQRFRFYCIAGYLPRLGKDTENGSI